MSDIFVTLLKIWSVYSELKYWIISFTFTPAKPPLVKEAVAIPTPACVATSIFIIPLGNLSFSKTASAVKSGKSVTPFCLTDLILLASKTVTVPTPTGKLTPFTMSDSPVIKVPDVWRSCIVSVLLIPATANPVAPLLLPSIKDDFGIDSSPYFDVFKINLV